jgi:hypothetical protein
MVQEKNEHDTVLISHQDDWCRVGNESLFKGLVVKCLIVTWWDQSK